MNAADQLLPHVGRTFKALRPRAGRAPVRTLLAVRLRVLPELHSETWAAQYRTPEGRERWITAGCFLRFIQAAVAIEPPDGGRGDADVVPGGGVDEAGVGLVGGVPGSGGG